ncbi:44149_t:CDS:2 [Gigaspora margarita]|uniref:44149_t:CDS:1 n=1 Tax=Gigaspora margarita TaxID=4874 RepID=A0ABN7UQU8_GIGMA|nr:44149_t:CDS:2 [Gigaspora margarita]
MVWIIRNYGTDFKILGSFNSQTFAVTHFELLKRNGAPFTKNGNQHL